MPEILRLLSCILYFTSSDQGEPLHIHIVPIKYRDNRKEHDEKLWIKEDGDSEISNYKGNIKESTLNNIRQIIKNDKNLFQQIVKEWCVFFDEKTPNFYKGKNITESLKKGKTNPKASGRGR